MGSQKVQDQGTIAILICIEAIATVRFQFGRVADKKMLTDLAETSIYPLTHDPLTCLGGSHLADQSIRLLIKRVVDLSCETVKAAAVWLLELAKFLGGSVAKSPLTADDLTTGVMSVPLNQSSYLVRNYRPKRGLFIFPDNF